MKNILITGGSSGIGATCDVTDPVAQALRPEDIARAFLYVVELPAHARIAEIEINPTVGAHPA